MKGLVGGPLSVGGLRPWPLASLKSGPAHTSSYYSFIVTMAVSCIVFEIKRDSGRKTPIFTPIVYNLHDPLEPLCSLAQNCKTNCPSP